MSLPQICQDSPPQKKSHIGIYLLYMKKVSIILIAVILIIIGFVIYRTNLTDQPVKQDLSHDGIYTIAGQKVTLKHGVSEKGVRYFGNDLQHDLNEDGRLDTVFFITHETGGSGTFYYIVARLDTTNGPVGSDAVFLGDRISPQTITLDEGKTTQGTNRKNVIVANYVERNPGESFVVPPSVGKSMWLKLDPETMQFGEVAQGY